VVGGPSAVGAIGAADLCVDSGDSLADVLHARQGRERFECALHRGPSKGPGSTESFSRCMSFFKHLVRVGSAAAGNAATRIEAFVISGGIRSYGGDPDIDALFRDQTVEMDKKRREALLHRIQQLMYERAMFAPIVEPALLTGVGPRLAEVPTITGHPYLSPYEDLKLKAR
jgi:hypothetical protein